MFAHGQCVRVLASVTRHTCTYRHMIHVLLYIIILSWVLYVYGMFEYIHMCIYVYVVCIYACMSLSVCVQVYFCVYMCIFVLCV